MTDSPDSTMEIPSKLVDLSKDVALGVCSSSFERFARRRRRARFARVIVAVRLLRCDAFVVHHDVPFLLGHMIQSALRFDVVDAFFEHPSSFASLLRAGAYAQGHAFEALSIFFPASFSAISTSFCKESKIGCSSRV